MVQQIEVSLQLPVKQNIKCSYGKMDSLTKRGHRPYLDNPISDSPILPPRERDKFRERKFDVASPVGDWALSTGADGRFPLVDPGNSDARFKKSMYQELSLN